MILVWYAVWLESRDGLLVAFLDVGQGDAIFIEASNGNQILVDAGPNKKVLSELSKIMPFYDRSIDMIIESHPDSDHIGGMIDVLRRYKIGAVMETGVDSDTAVYKTLENLIREKEIKKIMERRGMRINLDKGAYIDILFPDRGVEGWDTNDASIIVRVIYGNNSFLLTGDAPQKIENYLISLDGEKLKSNVLKLGHHGSKTSTSELFLGYVDPEYAIISAGKDNKYGHPHQEVIDELNQFKIPFLRTDEKGTIRIRSDGDEIVF
jgi:competence protein ComEC